VWCYQHFGAGMERATTKQEAKDRLRRSFWAQSLRAPRYFLVLALASVFTVATQSQISDVIVGLQRRINEVVSVPISLSRDNECVSPNDRDRLTELVCNHTVKVPAEAQFLVDFVIAGHPKTGTSSLMRLLARHPQVQMHEEEIRSLRKGQPSEFVKKMCELPHGCQYKRGYKAVCTADHFLCVFC
jgi:hypothetical protein